MTERIGHAPAWYRMMLPEDAVACARMLDTIQVEFESIWAAHNSPLSAAMLFQDHYTAQRDVILSPSASWMVGEEFLARYAAVFCMPPKRTGGTSLLVGHQGALEHLLGPVVDGEC